MIRQSGSLEIWWFGNLVILIYSGILEDSGISYSSILEIRQPGNLIFEKCLVRQKKSKGNESRKFLKILAKLWYGDNFLTRYLRGRRGIVGLEFLYIPVWTYLAFRFLFTSYLSNILIFITVASFLTGFLLSLVFASFLIAFAFLFPFLLLLLSHLLFIFLYNCFVVCYV